MALELGFDVKHHSVVVLLYKYMIINSRQVYEFSIVCAPKYTRTAPEQSICELLRVKAIPGSTRLHDNQIQNKRKLITVLLRTIQVPV